MKTRKFKLSALLLVLLMLLSTVMGCSQPTDIPGNDNANNKNDNQAGEQGGEQAGEQGGEQDETPIIIEKIAGFHDGLAAVGTNAGKGYIDTKGNIVIEPQYDEVENFSNGLACVAKNEKYGYINTKGETVIDFIYDTAESFDNELAWVTKDGVRQYIDQNGKVVYTVTEKEVAIGDYSNGFFWVETKEEKISGNVHTMTCYDKSGKVVFSLENATYGSDFNEWGYALINFTDGRGYRFVDSQGNEAAWLHDDPLLTRATISKMENNYVTFNFSYGNKETMWVDFENKTFHQVDGYYWTYWQHIGGSYYLSSSGKSSYQANSSNVILKNDKVIIELDTISEFASAKILYVCHQEYKDKDYFWVVLESSSKVIFTSLLDASGNVVISPTREYEVAYQSLDYGPTYKDYFMYRICAGRAMAYDRETGLLGFIDLTGNWVVQPQISHYSFISDFYGEGDDAVAVLHGEKIINRKGEVIFSITE